MENWLSEGLRWDVDDTSLGPQLLLGLLRLLSIPVLLVVLVLMSWTYGLLVLADVCRSWMISILSDHCWWPPRS